MKIHPLHFGLIGRNISYSFSKAYFTAFFKENSLPHTYQNFDLDTIETFPYILKRHPNLKGLNVTIPYKETVCSFLDDLSYDAKEIGAVNTIKIQPSGALVGYNTDVYGFERSLVEQGGTQHKRALILGTGGASKAVAYVLKKRGVSIQFVSRKQQPNVLLYTQLSKAILRDHTLIVNCTPLGTYPNVDDCPDIPYEMLTANHLLFDLVYNPPMSMFLQKGKSQGATVVNGQKMLEYQAQEAWRIWSEN